MKRNHFKSNLVSVSALLAALTILIFTSCSNEQEAIELQQVDSASGLAEEEIVRVDKSKFEANNMSFGKIEKRTFKDVIQANGMIEVPPSYRATISPYFEGYVSQIDILPGQKVKKGQTLFTMENPAYLDIQRDFAESYNKMKLLESNANRQRSLAKEKITAEKDLMETETQLELVRLQYEAGKRKMEMMHLSPEKVAKGDFYSVIPVISTINGFVVDVRVNKGSFIHSGFDAVDILNKEHMHLEISVFESDLSRLSNEQNIRIFYKGNTEGIPAKVHLVNDKVDEENRTITIHGHALNDSLLSTLTPGMFIEAEIYTNEEAMASLPDHAVLSSGDEYFVLVLTEESEDAYYFKKVQVEVGPKYEGYTALPNQDFSHEDQFLTEGGFYLLED